MLTLQATNSFGVVPDARNAEFHVQAILYHQLRARGVDVCGEVQWTNPETRERCRFDLVLYRDGRADHIVEVKAKPVKHKRGVEVTRQCRRYRRFGVPVTFVYGEDDIAPFVDFYLAGRQ